MASTPSSTGSSSGSSWLLVVLLAAAGGLFLASMAPARIAAAGTLGRGIVEARVYLALMALGILLGVFIPLMTRGL